MNVRVNIRLSVSADEKHLRVMRSSADDLTDTPQSVRVGVSAHDVKTVFAEFTIPKARQSDVVDKIAKRFALFMEDFADQSIGFPSTGSKRGAQHSKGVRTGGRIDEAGGRSVTDKAWGRSVGTKCGPRAAQTLSRHP